jgi:ABC-type transporter Mla maintaining outer membrane lipid asymmetry ATPase subunit MlaF
MPPDEPLVVLRRVVKAYGALRPLRVNELVLRDRERIALLGFDQTAAEVLVNLITAATLPDSGDVDIFGMPTRAIADAESWFQSLDRFGMLSERAVLIDELTIAQNLALPLSLEVDHMSPDVARQVEALADEVGISTDKRRTSMASADLMTRMRVRLGKALALDPRVLLVEHASVALPPDDVRDLAAGIRAAAERRSLAVLLLTADEAFAAAVCNRVLTVRPATGELAAASAWRNWFQKGHA